MNRLEVGKIYSILYSFIGSSGFARKLFLCIDDSYKSRLLSLNSGTIYEYFEMSVYSGYVVGSSKSILRRLNKRYGEFVVEEVKVIE